MIGKAIDFWQVTQIDDVNQSDEEVMEITDRVVYDYYSIVSYIYGFGKWTYTES